MADRTFRAVNGRGVLLADGVEHDDGTVDATLHHPIKFTRPGIESMDLVVASLEKMTTTGVTVEWGEGG